MPVIVTAVARRMSDGLMRVMGAEMMLDEGDELRLVMEDGLSKGEVGFAAGDDDGSIADAGCLINLSRSTDGGDGSIADAGCLINGSCSADGGNESIADAGCLINGSCSTDDDDESIADAGCLINGSCSADGGNGNTVLIARLPACLRAFVVRFFTFSSTRSFAHSSASDLADNSDLWNTGA